MESWIWLLLGLGVLIVLMVIVYFLEEKRDRRTRNEILAAHGQPPFDV